MSIVNADLIRDIDFYTGAFPIEKGGALSSMLDVRLRDGDPEKQRFKATLGASEVSLSGAGHIGRRTTTLFSLRQSYLQALFKMIGLPFLPNFIDGQFKVKVQLSPHDELTWLGLGGIDRMRLNRSGTTETSEYILSYLPRIEQETYTLGVTYRHIRQGRSHLLTLSQSYLNNRNIKYFDNDESSPENLMIRIGSTERKTTLRNENKQQSGRWSLRYGGELSRSSYRMSSFQRTYIGVAGRERYASQLGVTSWGVFVSGGYRSADRRLALSAGARADGSGYSVATQQFWRRLSPRMSASYGVGGGWTLNLAAGVYYQLPPLTALGYRDSTGAKVNAALDYMRVQSLSGGVAWQHNERLMISLEGFNKSYDQVPLSVVDGIPLSCKGDDYGTVGNERLVQSAQGRAYGAELMVRWQVPGRVSLVSSATLFRSLYRNAPDADEHPSAWDNRMIFTVSGTYFMKKGWSAGLKISAIGGAPYTPYDVAGSSLVEVWNTSGRPRYDYSLYNTCRLKAYAAADLRVDKIFYFSRWMLGVYVDLQNVTRSRYREQDIPLSTGEIVNPEAAPGAQYYRMKYLRNVSGTLLPTLGLTAEF